MSELDKFPKFLALLFLDQFMETLPVTLTRKLSYSVITTEINPFHFRKVTKFYLLFKDFISVRAGGARGAAAPPKFGELRLFGQQEKIWAKPVFKDVSMFFIIIIILKR